MNASESSPLGCSIAERLQAKADPYDFQCLASIFCPIPRNVATRLIAEWEARLNSDGRSESNRYALTVRDDRFPELFAQCGLPFDASDDDIIDAANDEAKRMRYYLLQTHASETGIRASIRRATGRYRVEPPPCKTLSQLIARLCDPAWWRRALRKRFRLAEHAAIRAGCVHRHAAPYVSNEAFRRHERQALRTARFLELAESENLNTGEILSLTQLAQNSLANPTHRRAAMMVCIRGLEERAKALGFVPLFLTITCPSRMHARREKSGDATPCYDGTSPRNANRYLGRIWSEADRKLSRSHCRCKQEYFGVRVVEPHHDATPHWHFLAFVHPDHQTKFVEVLRAYALRDSPDEPGATERRFDVKVMDPEKGSAAGYIAKYVSKNIDGVGVGEDCEAGTAARVTATRAVAWARLWGIRQFQFFGIGTVTPFREFYRLDGIAEPLEAIVGDVWRAAKDGDFAAYIAARDTRRMRLAGHYEERTSQRYPGEQSKQLRGISVKDDAGWIPIITRKYVWRMRYRVPESPSRQEHSSLTYTGFAFPWTRTRTRFNNSARLEFKTFLAEQRAVREDELEGCEKRIAPSRAPLPGKELAIRTKGWSEAYHNEEPAQEVGFSVGSHKRFISIGG